MVLLAGLDDSGRGPVIGPMVIAGVVLDENDIPKLKELGVKDSKLLTPNQRTALYDKILNIVKNSKIIILTPQAIDAAVLSSNSNLNFLEAETFATIINTLKPDRAIVDCPSTNIKAYTTTLSNMLTVKTTLRCEHHADRDHIVVGAASILAKVTRDREIEKIHKKIGVNFGSLHFNEEVLIEKQGVLSLEKIGPLVENGPWDIHVFSFNTQDYSIRKYPVTDFIEHPRTPIYNIQLDFGKEVKLSKNHPVFCLNENLDICARPINKLKIGDRIAVCSDIKNSSQLSNLDLVELLHDQSTKKSPLYAKVSKRFILHNKTKLFTLIAEQKYERTAYYAWLKGRYLPLHIFSHLQSSSNVKLCSREDTLQFPRYFKITKEFMWFLGIYLAEGWLSPYRTYVASEDKTVIKRLQSFSQKYGIIAGHNKKKGDIGLSSILFSKLIKELVKGNNAYTKEIPDFVFSTNKTMICSLLDGLYYGDGYLNDSSKLEIELRSKRMILQIQWLNLLLGKFSSNRKRNDKPAFITAILSDQSNSLCPYNLPPVVGKYIKNLREYEGLSYAELSKKSKVSKHALFDIEKQAVSSFQRKTIEKILRILPDKKLASLCRSNICWLRIKSITYLEKDKVYDLGVSYKNIENFLGGQSGIILHNSGYPADPITQAFIKDNWNKYPEIFRHSWSTYKAYSEGKKQKAISDFT